MILTNRFNLPQPIVSAVANDAYSKGDADISVTGLLKPPRQALLESQYQDEIVEDASSRVWSLLGQSIHTILERANRSAVAERRLSMELCGWKISGGMDLYEEDGTLIDFKVTSVHKLIQGNLDEWTRQLNLYSVLLRHHSFKVKKLQVVCILRDWSKMEAKRNLNYPKAQVVNVGIPLWDSDQAIEFMRQRVILHQKAKVHLPECTEEDRWARSDVWAVMKKNRKSAVRLYSHEEDATTHASSSKDLYVIHRPGMNVRCENYCQAFQFCTQAKRTIQSKIEIQKIKENKDDICA